MRAPPSSNARTPPQPPHTLHTYPVLLAPHRHTPPGRCDAAPGVDSVLSTRYSVLLLLVGVVFPLEVKDGCLVRGRVRVWVKVRVRARVRVG
eukprot:scaffold123931_cov63-Phaeocystis_antarctica.AAC.3